MWGVEYNKHISGSYSNTDNEHWFKKVSELPINFR